MEKQNTQLKSARIKRDWTPEFVSDMIGVSRHTYMRWESGLQTPRLTSLDALCRVFGMTATELGFPDQFESTTWQSQANESGQMALTYAREVAEQTPNLAQSLLTWNQGMQSCWEWYMTGNQVELESLVPDYLTELLKPALTPGPEQAQAASLTSQVYQLLALLDLQRGDFVSAQNNATQAVVYSQLAHDGNMYVAAQLRLAGVYTARKRTGSALLAFNDALRFINRENETISPILHSWIFAGLAEIQATMGREKDALQFLQLAVAVFPPQPEDDACFAYTRCDQTLLYLCQGLVFLRLGQSRLAWDAFAQVDDLRPKPPERVRAEFLHHRAYTSLMLGNMLQSCIYLEASARAAQTLNSDWLLSQVYTLYEHMLAVWGQEPRVRSLAKLFQQ